MNACEAGLCCDNFVQMIGFFELNKHFSIVNMLKLDISNENHSKNKEDYKDYEEFTKICKICLDNDESDLISPCKCSGSQKYVHKDCLNSWMQKKFTDFEKACCEMCKSKYNIKVVYKRKCKRSHSDREVFVFLCKIWVLCSILALLIFTLASITSSFIPITNNTIKLICITTTSFLLLLTLLLLSLTLFSYLTENSLLSWSVTIPAQIS